MIDFIYKFDSKDLAPNGEPPCWQENGVTYMPVRVVLTPAVWVEGEEYELITPEVVAEGYWLVASTNGGGPPLPNPIAWSEVPGQVTPTFAGRDFPLR